MKRKLHRQAPFIFQKDVRVSNRVALLHRIAASKPVADKIGDIPPSMPFSISSSITVTSNT